MINYYVYDIETYPNIFTCAIGDVQTRKMKVFEISSRKDEREELFEYLRDIVRAKGYMVGFNNIGFDYPVLHFLLKNKQSTVIDIYDKAQQVIGDWDNRFAHVIPDKHTMIKQIDLLKVHHFDNKARATSLKVLEFNMEMDDIQDLPYEVGRWLTNSEMDNLIKYNAHDIKATFKFFEKSKKEIDFRHELSKKYKKNVLNFNDTKIGKDYLISELEREHEGICYEYSDGRRKMRQTFRNSIKLNECIFDYIEYERPEFNAVLNWLKGKTITETKGVFTGLLESDIGEVAKYAEMETKSKKLKSEPSDRDIRMLKQEQPMGWVEERPLKSGKVSYYWCYKEVKSLNVVINGLTYVFGTGGIHASVSSETFLSDDEYVIEDRDVKSYYPNLAIRNRIYPEHLGEYFCDIYEGVYDERRKYASGTIENALFKLALNGTYGDSNSEFSPLYDPKFTMMITINGQLSLCMLAEELLKIEGLTMIQLNTDGLTYRVPRKHRHLAQKACDEWEEITKLELELAEYSKMAIRDVNNYVSVDLHNPDKVKTKGAYEYEGLGWNKNFSNLIIPMAAVQQITKGIPVEQTIRECQDVHKFMARTKIPRSSKLILTKADGVEVELQNTTRYYISKGGGQLTKIMPPLPKGKIVWDCINPDGEVERVDTKGKMETRKKREGWVIKEVELAPLPRPMDINSGQKVTPCNRMKEFAGMHTIDYDWYIEEASKLANLGECIELVDE